MASANPNNDPPPAYSEEPPTNTDGGAATPGTPGEPSATPAIPGTSPAPPQSSSATPVETKSPAPPYSEPQNTPGAAAPTPAYPVQPGASQGPVQKPYPVQPGGDYIQFVPFGQPLAPSENYTIQQSEGFVIADFYPRCLTPGRKAIDQLPQFEPFSCLVRQANHWLMSNPAYRVMRCESVEVDAEYTGKVHSDSCVQMESGNAVNVYVRGLRLWCRVDLGQAVKAPHQLWYINVVPYCRHAGQSLGAALGENNVLFEGVNETIQRLNAQLANSPLPGTVVSVEQVELKLSSSTNLGAFNLDESCWGSDPNKGRFFLKCIRVFYVMEPGPDSEQVGVAVISPTGSMKALSLSKWSCFNDVMCSTAHFMLGNPNICITNIQTVIYPKTTQRFNEGPARKITLDVDPTFHIFRQETTSVYAMWIGYTVKPTPAPAFPSGQVTCRTFTPYKIGERTYEPVSGCLSRISTWVRLTNNRLVASETCTVYHNPDHEVIHDEKMSHDAAKGALQHRITIFRLYFDGPVVEPPPQMLPKPQPLKSSVCNIL